MKKALGFCLFFYSIVSFAQQRVQSSSEIYQDLLKLNTVGSAMYVAAHPDDENTLLITWLSKYQKVETAYIAMTRGDGGQNLLGTEQGAAAGVLRTQELLKARSVDGGKQFFTRAVDFGYTKTTDEALQTWGEEKVLYDLVFRIRKFQPDVMITRFPPDERAGHGHHSASAVLAAEAFDFAADATKFPDQLKEVTVWQPKRLVWNHYARGFRNQSPEEGSYIEVSLGDYNEVLGESYPEIAAEARSMHKSQGFGAAKVRNQRTDYLLHVKGEPAKSSVFDGV
ncbi:MAG: PIG-L family deacetylase, partial [Spirosomataceae bacterium]